MVHYRLSWRFLRFRNSAEVLLGFERVRHHLQVHDPFLELSLLLNLENVLHFVMVHLRRVVFQHDLQNGLSRALFWVNVSVNVDCGNVVQLVVDEEEGAENPREAKEVGLTLE